MREEWREREKERERKKGRKGGREGGRGKRKEETERRGAFHQHKQTRSPQQPKTTQQVQ